MAMTEEAQKKPGYMLVCYFSTNPLDGWEATPQSVALGAMTRLGVTADQLHPDPLPGHQAQLLGLGKRDRQSGCFLQVPVRDDPETLAQVRAQSAFVSAADPGASAAAAENPAYSEVIYREKNPNDRKPGESEGGMIRRHAAQEFNLAANDLDPGFMPFLARDCGVVMVAEDKAAALKGRPGIIDIAPPRRKAGGPV
jgi:hypothetical protein